MPAQKEGDGPVVARKIPRGKGKFGNTDITKVGMKRVNSYLKTKNSPDERHKYTHENLPDMFRNSQRFFSITFFLVYTRGRFKKLCTRRMRDR